METFVSFALYIGTFLIALFIGVRGNYANKSFKKIFVIWLYIFLCFGYMTGSDWRSYESEYDYAAIYHKTQYLTELGFNALYVALSSFINDFFLSLGILKCIYLYSLIKLLKSYTSYWLAAVAILMPVSLLFMLIDNPLRFMCALVFVNLALYYNFKHKSILTYVLLITAVLFHTTSIVFLIMPVIIRNSYRIYSINSILLGTLYIVILYLTSDIDLINNIKTSMISLLLESMEIKDYSSYIVESDGAFFTLGSFLQMGVFILILATKRYIKKDESNLGAYFGMTIVYLFFQRIFLLIPSGFRLVIPYGYFFAIFIACMLISKRVALKRFSYILLTYLSLTLCKNLYTGYVYVPYSNSIPYILSDSHKNAGYRDRYNKDAYFERTGKHFGS